MHQEKIIIVIFVSAMFIPEMGTCYENDSTPSSGDKHFKKPSTFELYTLASIGGTHSPNADTKNSKGKIGIKQLFAELGIMVPVGLNSILLVHVKYDLFQPTLFSPFKNEQRFHSLSLPIELLIEKNRFDFYFNMTTYINSDFEKVTSKDFALDAIFMCRYWINEKVVLGIGGAVTKQLSRFPLVPLGYIGVFPSRYFDVKITLPQELILSTHVWRKNRRIVDIQAFSMFSGSRFHYDRKSKGTFESGYAHHETFNTGLGLNAYPFHFLKIGISSGWNWTQLKSMFGTEDDSYTRSSVYFSGNVAVGAF